MENQRGEKSMNNYCKAEGCLETPFIGEYCLDHARSRNFSKPADPLAEQVGGDHYKGMVIQPVQYIHANKLPYMEGNVVKYISRHRNKNGAADVKKAIHYCQLILQLHYGEEA